MQLEMNEEMEIKQQVREFYDQIGWQEVSEGCYQNASYEDLRPISSEYIHRCHMRVLRHLKPQGRYLLDAGSGPIQYPEYLEYSRNYHKRVCLDISSQALREARKRIGEHGLFVIADIACLPFQSNAFDGLVSLHTIHHLPQEEHLNAYCEFQRVLSAGSTAVVVNGWDNPPLMAAANLLLRLADRAYRLVGGSSTPAQDPADRHGLGTDSGKPQQTGKPTGTYVHKHNAAWLIDNVGSQMQVEIWAWRSVNVRFLRTLVHARWGGRMLLRMLYWLEERFPHFFGRYGQYPLIVIRK